MGGSKTRSNPRALDADEVARIRARLDALYREYGENDSKVAVALGVSQQGAGRLRNRLQTPGLHTAKAIARHDRVPFEILLKGCPDALYTAISRNPRRWRPPTVAMVSLLPQHDIASRQYGMEDWVSVLDRAEKLIEQFCLAVRSG